MIEKGHIFLGPNGHRYRLLANLGPGSTIRAADFEPLDGAPKPVPNETIPEWLDEQLRSEYRARVTDGTMKVGP